MHSRRSLQTDEQTLLMKGENQVDQPKTIKIHLLSKSNTIVDETIILAHTHIHEPLAIFATCSRTHMQPIAILVTRPHTHTHTHTSQ